MTTYRQIVTGVMNARKNSDLRADDRHIQERVDEELADLRTQLAEVTRERDKLLSVLECAKKTAKRRGEERDRLRERWEFFNHSGQPHYGLAKWFLGGGDIATAKYHFAKFEAVWDSVPLIPLSAQPEPKPEAPKSTGPMCQRCELQ